jgi:hypothetical protein
MDPEGTKAGHAETNSLDRSQILRDF